MIEKINRAEALRYMGCASSNVDSNVLAIVEDCEKELLSSIKPKYVYKFFDIIHLDEGIELCETNTVFTGRDIANHLRECNRAVLLCATLSVEADKVIRKYQITDMAYALASDALASAAIEQVCDAAEEEIKQSAPYITWRFSPGYGDLPIELQNQILALTDAPRKIGLTVTENSILIPRKSVTAIIGVSSAELPVQKRGCAVCNMRESCQYRKRGTRCGF